MKPINQTIAHLKPSGIRKYFDLANSMEGVISLGVGGAGLRHTVAYQCESSGVL